MNRLFKRRRKNNNHNKRSININEINITRNQLLQLPPSNANTETISNISVSTTPKSEKAGININKVNITRNQLLLLSPSNDSTSNGNNTENISNISVATTTIKSDNGGTDVVTIEAIVENKFIS